MKLGASAVLAAGALLLAASFTAPRAAAATSLPERASYYRDALMDHRDPGAADGFLKDEAVIDFLKQNSPRTYDDLIRAALQLKDLRDLIQAHNDDTDGSSLNDAFKARFIDHAAGYFGFGDHPQELIQWSLNYPPSEQDVSILKQALWQWDALAESERLWLRASGQTQDSWEKASFARRQKLSSQWASAVYDRLWPKTPQSENDLKRMERVQGIISQGLNESQDTALRSYIDKAKHGVAGVDELERNAKVLSDRKLQSLLAQAKHAYTTDEQLAALGRIFDALGVNKPELQAIRPLSAAQKFSSDEDRALLGKMLGPALLAEIGGAEVGRRVQEFYRTHPLRLKIGAVSSDAFADFDHDSQTITIGDGVLNEWLRTRRLTLRDLFTRPSVLHEFVVVLAPMFVHESIHFEQHAYRQSRHLQDWGVQDQEVEAEAAEALYVLQRTHEPCKTAKPCYKKFLEQIQGESSLVRDDIKLADKLNRQKEEFPNFIATDYYWKISSLESAAVDEIRKGGRVAGKAGKEMCAYAVYKSYHQSFMKGIYSDLARLNKNHPVRLPEKVPPPVKASMRGGQ